jgi:capsular polysaccharide biosynthesis protein/Mrp family chromosome partitioning ATPase
VNGRGQPVSAADDVGAALRAVGRRAWPAALVFALTLLAALGVSRLGPSRYQATAEILLQQPDQVNAVLNPDAITSAANVQREVNTNAQLITSVPVLDSVRRQLGLHESARELASRLSVAGEATSNLVEITAEDVEPRRAARVATAVAEQYQTYRRRSAQEAIGSAVDAAAILLQGMDAAARRSAEGRALEARLHQLETGAAVATGGVQVVRPASLPSTAEPRVPPLTAAVILLLALTLAGVAVLVLEHVDRRLLDEADVASAFGKTVIARVPAPGARAGGMRRRIEAFDALAVRLRSRSGAGRVVMVAAAAPYAHDDVAIRLTEALADLEPRALLIDADLRLDRGAPDELTDSGGLTSVLLGRSTLDDELVLASYRQDDDDPLPVRAWEFLPAGSGASRPTALLGGCEMSALLALVRDRAEVVLVTTPAFGSGADASVLAPLCDEILLVVRERSATREQAERTCRALEGIATPIAGVILESGAPSRRWPFARRRRRLVIRRERRRADESSRPSAARA